MDDRVWTSFDNVLVQIAVEIGKTRSAKKQVDHQINLCTTKITEEENQIAWLEENIKKDKEELADLQKQNEVIKKSCDVWKPTYTVLKKHEAYLKNEIAVVKEDIENEREIYENSIAQCRKTLEEYRTKYKDSALAQEYYKKKEEVEEIQKRALEWLKKCKWKEDTSLDALESFPLTSINAWAVYTASVRKKAQETMELVEATVQETIKLEKEAEELPKKIDYLKKTFEEAKEKQNNSQKIEEKNQKSLEKPEEFKERVFGKRQQPSLPKERRQLHKILPVPCIPQKFVQSVQGFRFSKPRPETGVVCSMTSVNILGYFCGK